jgi:Domain of unknown function (DUF1918)
MKAEVGDELIIESPQPGVPGRIGTIVALHNTDGSPPYVVHWLAGDYDSRIDPGPKARIERHHPARTPSNDQPAAGATEAAVSANASGRGT